VSILTKVFLIVVAILSIALATLSIAANSLSSSWKRSAEDWKAAALAAQANERTVAVQAKLTHEQDLDKLRKLNAEVERLKAELQRTSQDLEAKTVELSQAQTQSAALTANVTGLRETLEMVNAQFAREQEFNRKTAGRNAELERRNIDLNERVKELTSELAMATTQVRALQQQLGGGEAISGPRADATFTPAPVASTGGLTVEPFQPQVAPGGASVMAPIRARITGVRGNVAGISVGSADGVAPGMRFLVHRGGTGASQYIGTLQVTRVEANESAGTLIRTTAEVQPGDSATDEASFALRR